MGQCCANVWLQLLNPNWKMVSSYIHILHHFNVIVLVWGSIERVLDDLQFLLIFLPFAPVSLRPTSHRAHSVLIGQFAEAWGRAEQCAGKTSHLTWDGGHDSGPKTKVHLFDWSYCLYEGLTGTFILDGPEKSLVYPWENLCNRVKSQAEIQV